MFTTGLQLSMVTDELRLWCVPITVGDISCCHGDAADQQAEHLSVCVFVDSCGNSLLLMLCFVMLVILFAGTFD